MISSVFRFTRRMVAFTDLDQERSLWDASSWVIWGGSMK